GSSGIKPRLADLIAEELDDNDALKLVENIINFIKVNDQRKRLGWVIEEMGLEEFKKKVL
ncbi:MAG TPA: NAD(P)/FAD-dependent oxidoreductase, partial [Candidatus Nanoarchaeia archaeon]|nr:NAD(P)/FAD-dependent oxidoreductase [Candidatus Nanoarchaeia archaeon]